MLNEIKVPHGANGELSRIFKKSRPFVRKALRGQNNDYLSLQIRSVAIQQFGGYEIQKINDAGSNY